MPKSKLFTVIAFTFVISFSLLLITVSVMYIPQQVMAQAKAVPTTTPPPLPSMPSSSSSSPPAPSSSSPSSVPTSAPPSSSSIAGRFQTYKNPILGLKIQYPSNWLLKQHPYNATGSSTIATFISPTQSATAASGSQAVQDRFAPYVDVFVFDSNGSPLDQLIDESVNHGNLLNATISQSKPITLNGGKQAHMVEYSIIIADRYLFDRMQVWTESGSKVIVISYTSEPQTYLTYLPNMQQMIQSLEIASPPGMQSNNPVANSSAQQQQQQQQQRSSDSNSQTMDDGSSSSSSSTIPWLP